MPSTSKLGKKSAQLKSVLHVPSSKLDDSLSGKDKKEGLDNEHSREKEKSATSRTKNCDGLSDQHGDGTAVAQLRDLKKKQANDVVSIASNNSDRADNMRVKVTKTKCKDDEAVPAKKCKKDTCSSNKFADRVQVADFIYNVNCLLQRNFSILWYC